MKIIKYVKNFKILSLIKLTRSLFLNKLLILRFYKKKRKIRNSYQSSTLVKNFISNSLNFEKVCNIFFNKNLFSYSNMSEKEELIKILNHNCSIEIQHYIELADKIIRNEFSIFEKNHNFKNQINWHYSFFHNYNWQLIKSEKIDIRPNIENVDVKYVWEFNRHNFLSYLGVAYYFTKNEKYAKKFKQIVLDWIKKNPPLYGINWYSGLEISIRLISWIFSLFFFKESKKVNNKNFFEQIFSSMFQHAYFLRYFYTRHSFNHTIGDIFGVYLFSKIFEDINPIKKWERIFFKKFSNQIFLQTRVDGTNIEQSVNYHRFVLEFFSLFVILNPNNIDEKALHLIEKMYEYLLYIIKPNHKSPLIGDFDEGNILPLIDNRENSLIDLINLGAILFHRGDFKYISKKKSPISIFLLGTKGNQLYEKIQFKEPDNKIRFFENAGYFVIRNNWSDKANYLFVDYGRFGPLYGAHSHSSVSNLIFSYRGKDIIIDSGTYTYNKSWEDRNLFRGSQAHNILTINNQNQAKITNWFAWEDKPKIKRNVRIQDNSIELVCFHDGYDGFIVRRTISTKKDLNNIVIRDSVFKIQRSSKDKIYNIDIYFHLKGDIDVKVDKDQVTINNYLAMEVSSEHNFKLNIDKSFYSPRYGIKYENNIIKISIRHSFDENRKVEVLTKISVRNQ